MPGWYCRRCGHEGDAELACPRDGERMVRVSTTDLPGRTLGEYRILANIGGGAFGTVYRAAHATTGTIVAIKLLHQSWDTADSQRVTVEATAAAMIQHPNCIRVFDLRLTHDRRPYIVMQFLDGVPLSNVATQRLSVAEAVTLTADVLSGLSAVHARGVVHRDLKPGNIFVSNGRAVIVDFGLAKLISDPKAPNLTVTGEAIGTPAYMAPEQIRAGKSIDGRADLYAMGCVLYEILANRRPFPGKATLEVFKAHLNQVAPPITTFRPDVPPRVAAVIEKALAKDPADRWQTAEEMRAALVVPPPRARWPLFAGLGGVVVVVAVAVIAAASSSSSSAQEEHAPPPPVVDAAVARVMVDAPSPPPVDAAPLTPELEQSLAKAAQEIEAGTYKHATAVKMFCSMERLQGSPSTKAETRAYARRLAKLLRDRWPELDPNKCPE
ncbi:MAG: serine/threonine protein kinase [Deltaproteobacteria bacterium]|nr:serine/threonine protein kinase [Deltaproteobacteria bacterium]